MQKLLLAGIVSAAGALSFGLGFNVHFPSDAVLDFARWQIQQSSGGAWALDADDASWWMPAGVHLSDATLFKVDAPKSRRKKRAKPEDASAGDVLAAPLAAVPFLRAEDVSLRLALLPLLTGRTALEFALDAYGGEIEGSVGEDAEFTTVEAMAEGINLARMPIGGDDWNINAVGKLKLNTDLKLAKKTGRDGPGHDGSLRMEIEGLIIESASVMGIDLMPATFSQAVLEIEMDGTKAEVREGRFQADILDLTVSGHINATGGDPDRWRLRLELQLDLEDQLDIMAGMLPMLKSAKDDEGIYHLLCSGTVGRPSCREDRSKVRGTPARPSAPSIGGPPAPPSRRGRPQKAASDDSEERRAERRERIKERREKLRQERETRQGDSIDEEIDDREFEDMREPMRPFPREPGNIRPDFPDDEFDGGPDELDDRLPAGEMDIQEPLDEIGYVD